MSRVHDTPLHRWSVVVMMGGADRGERPTRLDRVVDPSVWHEQIASGQPYAYQSIGHALLPGFFSYSWNPHQVVLPTTGAGALIVAMADVAAPEPDPGLVLYRVLAVGRRHLQPLLAGQVPSFIPIAGNKELYRGRPASLR